MLNVAQVAADLQVGRTTVFRLLREGDLKAVKVGRTTRVRQSELNAYIKRLQGNRA
jgi:excisionase family DNA binding protein